MKFTLSRHIGKFAGDRRVISLLILIALAVAGRAWLAAHPQHDPWAPLDLNDPVGWATEAKLLALRGDVPQCRGVLERSGVAFSALEPAGEGPCRREDRTQLSGFPLSPDTPPTTCPVAIGLQLWKRDGIDPAAQEIFGSEVAQIEHLGAYSCRRLYGNDEGPWSQHATGNALDVAGFVLVDGTRISVLGDWDGDGDKARFLREVRDRACDSFGIVLSPDYNAAHADHFHLDMGARRGGLCR